jgi:poly(3-hydroxybutyrate) depolymerase
MKKHLILFLIFFNSLVGCEKNSVIEQDNTVKITLNTKIITITQVIDGNPQNREVIIQTPNNIDVNKNYPIVFAFHGRGGTHSSWVNKLKSFTNNGEFVGVYPQGFLKSWNLGNVGSEPSNANDVVFVSLIIEELKKHSNLDFNKMYAIGTSNGSGMVNKLAIELSDFNAVASIVSQLTEGMPIKESTKSISIFQINGAADSTIPIDGGSKLGHVFLDAKVSAELWASNFNCNPNPELKMIGEDTLYVYKNCSKNNEVRYLRVEKGEHNLHWGNPEIFDTIWTFFQRF